MSSEVAGLDPLHGYLKHGNLVVRMRFPYLELPNNAQKFLERKMTATAARMTAQPEPVAVKEAEPVIEAAPLKKPPVAVSEQLEPPAQVNEQQHFFE
ncbi:hypothetical protein [Tunturiibacter lichenicola]|jgi:hypothetical protein|uniref:hypothetical protein n=1 Tax=Tunturiibacter lichenicola TaxID=2051959 RepID=UPI003D9BFD50